MVTINKKHPSLKNTTVTTILTYKLGQQELKHQSLKEKQIRNIELNMMQCILGTCKLLQDCLFRIHCFLNLANFLTHFGKTLENLSPVNKRMA